MYDAIIVGGRVAGATTALLLARKGYRVLVVERATFPSDTLSTHQIQIPGSLTLQRCGLLEQVLATNPGASSHIRFDVGEAVVTGQYPTIDGINFVQSPRRYLLDQLLLAAAAKAGAEVREGYLVHDLLEEAGKIVGIRGQGRAGGVMTERARIVIGADGKHSLVAKAVGASYYQAHPTLTCGYYAYWEGISLQGNEIYFRDQRFMVLTPTNDQLTLLYVAWPAAEFPIFRANVEESYLATIAHVPTVAERVRQGRRVERIKGSGDLPNWYRKTHGAGWALVGDASYVKDPVTAMGISDAFQEAEWLSQAVHQGLSGQQSLDSALTQYEQQRTTATQPTYTFTLETARLRPIDSGQLALITALNQHPTEASQFFGVLTGIIKPTDFFTPQRLFHLIGLRSLTKILMQRFLPITSRVSH